RGAGAGQDEGRARPGPRPAERHRAGPAAAAAAAGSDPAASSAGGGRVIVRIMGEGQIEISPEDIAVLNELDSELESAIEAGDEQQFRVRLHALLDKVRHVGKSLPDDSLEPSELILPPADASIDEVREMLGDQGLIPG